MSQAPKGSPSGARACRVAALLLCLGLASAGCTGKKPARTPRYPVTVAQAETRAVPHEIEATGTIEPLQSVAVTSQVGGVVTRVAFREGGEVRPGQLLVQIDPRPFELDRMRAQAALSRDRAQYTAAALQADRAQALLDKELVSRQEFETRQAAADALLASVRSDSAALASARLNLEYAAVRSPIEGRAGSLNVREGNMVKASDVGNPILTINRMRPIRARFSVPQGELAAILRQRSRALPVTAFPDTGDAGGIAGTLQFLDNAVDPATGTIVLKAEFPNRDGALWPGQFVRTLLQLDIERGALVVPGPAVSSGQSGTFVYVLRPDTTVELRPVRLSRTYKELAVIASGLKPGETVVTDGQARLSPGARVSLRKPGKGAAGSVGASTP